MWSSQVVRKIIKKNIFKENWKSINKEIYCIIYSYILIEHFNRKKTKMQIRGIIIRTKPRYVPEK